MSNQRPAKKVSAMSPEMKDMTVLKFFKNAQKVLEEADKPDEAFYFEQMVDWLQQGKPLPLNEETTVKALGV